MQYKSAKTLSGLQIPKIKCYCLHNASPYVVFLLPPYYSDLSLWLFCVLKIKSLCNANVTVDVKAFFPLFVLIFQVGLRSFQYYLAVRTI